METNLKFNSQICTTKIQSERLLALGLKKETADMTLQTSLDVCYTMSFQDAVEYFENRHLPPHPTILPAWSLHRLLKMIPTFIDIGEHSYMFSMIQGRLVSYRSDIAGNALLYGKGSVYDSVIYTIEWLIGEGLFNKEYLEE